MNPRQYWTACRMHDWFYSYSDDPGVYRAGKEDRERLMLLTQDRPELAEIFKAWQDHHFDCGPVPAEPKTNEETTSKKGKTTVTYTITRTVPIPKTRKPGSGRKSKYPFRAMTPGDSFFAPDLSKKTVYAAAWTLMKKTNGKTKFKVMEVNENGVNGTRVWRVK